MIDEGSTRLLDRLEQRAAALLALLRESRVQQDALQSRLAELERRRVELEAGHAERAAEAREEQAARRALAERCRELEARLEDLEATRLELAEENRELDEQNRELEAHNRRLLAQDPAEAGTVLFHRQSRRAQGLTALIGARTSRQSDAPTELSAAAPTIEPAEAVASAADDRASTGADAPSADEAPPSPQALLDQWYRRYSSTFFKGHTRPLQVGIHEALSAREPWPEKLVRRALACYVNLPRYLKSVREGAWRLDLAGEPAGQVDAAAAEHARKKLERLQADRRQRERSSHGRGRSGAKRHRDADAEERRGEDGGKVAPTASKVSSGASMAPSSPGRPATGAPEGPPAASLDEKLTALLAKHNRR